MRNQNRPDGAERLGGQAMFLRDADLTGDCPAWIRTMTEGSKDLCAAITPRGTINTTKLVGEPGWVNLGSGHFPECDR